MSDEGCGCGPSIRCGHMSTLPFTYPETTAPNPAAVRKVCRHPRDRRQLFEGGVACGGCGKEIDPERIARGRRSNRRGRTIQRKAMTRAGMDNLAGNLPGLDGRSEMFHGESKSGAAFPRRLWRWLKAIPTAPGQIGVLVVTSTPGPGHKSESVVVLDLKDWEDVHNRLFPRDSDAEIQPVDPYLEKAG